MGTIQFKKAVKYDARGRVALIGPAGSGKSFTGLVMARELAGPQGKIAAVDTEHGSLSKYADLFEFDVFELDSFSPNNFMEALTAAEDAHYDVFLCDSLSHFWMGKDGALEFVDMATKRSQSRDGMAGWKDFSPVERRMVDAMIASPCHVITTMRTKTEYQEQEYTNSRGEKKKQRVKVGLAPVQRQGLEYEFDLIGYMDENNALLIDKTRCPDYTGKVLTAPKATDFKAFGHWLKGVQREAAPPPAAPKPIVVPPPAPIVEISRLDQILATFTKAEPIEVACKGLRAEFCRVLDGDTFDQIFMEHGLGEGQTRTTGKARKAFSAAWMTLEKATAEIQTAQEPAQ